MLKCEHIMTPTTQSQQTRNGKEERMGGRVPACRLLLCEGLHGARHHVAITELCKIQTIRKIHLSLSERGSYIHDVP